MTKDEARKLLEWYLSLTKDMWTDEINLPIEDAIISKVSNGNINEQGDEGDFTVEEYSFKGLLKIAYDL